jgi:iron complex outermembrane recepter protein
MQKSNDKLRRAIHAICLGGASTLSLTAASTSMAQQAPAAAGGSGELEEVVVTGLRASLQHSLDIKRESDGVVDAISAEDIGKFPDSNLAAAMQRIPGISVSRGTSSMGGVPTSSGDATEITVRGFGPTFNQTLSDGRQIASGIGNRGFDFSSVGADFVGEVDVMKTPDSTLSSGAIGATINIKYPKPFDNPGMHAAGSFAMAEAPDEGKYSPNVSALFSDTFANDTFGVLVDVVSSDHKIRANHVNIQGWEGSQIAPSQLAGAAVGASPQASITDWFIQDYGIYQEHTEDKRTDGRVVVQWKPSSDVLVTVNDDYSRDNLSQSQYGYSVWFNNGSLTNITQAADGTLLSFVQPNTPTDFQSQINGSVVETNTIGANVKWSVGNHAKYEFDVDQSVSKLNPGGQLSSIDVDVGYGPSVAGGTNGTNVGIAGVGSGSLPYPTNYGPGGNAAQFINNGLIGSHVLPMSSPRNGNTIDQLKLQGMWTEDRLILKYGLQYSQSKENLSEVDDFQNNDWQAYGGYGPASNNLGTHGVALPQNLFTNSFSTSSFISGFSNSGNLPPNILAFNPYAVLNYLQGLGNPQTTNIPGANVNCCNPPFNGIYQMANSVGAFQIIEENTISPYMSLNLDEKIAQMPLKINMGLRYDRTETFSTGITQLPTSLTVQPSDHTAFLVTYAGSAAPITTSNRYQYVLPNLDLSLGIADDWKLRFDASRTLTRAPLIYLTPDLNVGQGQRVGSLVATGGNPTLLPFLSDNIDLGVEWYYAQNSMASADFFVKDVTNFVVGGTTRQSINGVMDPTTGQLAQFSVTTQVNGPSAEVHGLELNVQHLFGNTGFGLQANATFVSSNRPYDSSQLLISGFAITGLANSSNLVAFYEKYGYQARVAINHRGEYLDHFGQQQNNSQYSIEPTFVNASTQVDFSAQYDINKNFSVYFEALNLNDETYSTHGRFSEQVLDVIDYGRRFTLGVHVKL